MMPLLNNNRSSSSAADRRWWALVLLAMAEFVVVLDASIVNVALPTIKEALDFSEDSLPWVVNAYVLTFGGFLLLGGRLADLLGRRRLFMAGLILFALASLAGGLAADSGQLIAARAATSQPGLWARPPASEAIEKRMRPATKTRRRPSRSAMRPPSSRKPPNTSVYALTTQDRSSVAKSRSRPIEGSATFTIEASRTTMNCAAARSASARPLREIGADSDTGGGSSRERCGS